MADQIQIYLDVKTNIQSAVNNLNDLNAIVKKVAGSTSALGTAFSSIRSVILPVIAAFSFKEIIEQGEKLDNVFKKIGQLSKQTGLSFKAIENAANSLSRDGLIPLEDSITSLRNLLRTGMSLEQARKLLNAFRESAALGSKDNESLSESLKKATTAFLTGEVRLLRTIGIYVNAQSAQREYAIQLGITKRELTDSEKRQALYNAVIQQASKFTGDYALVQEDFATKIKTIKNELFLAAGAIGRFITNTESAGATLDVIIESLRAFNLGINTVVSGIYSLIDLFDQASKAALNFYTTLQNERPKNQALLIAKEIQDLRNKLSDSPPIDPLKVDPTKNRAARDQLLKEIDFIANSGREKVLSIPNQFLSSLASQSKKQLANIEKEFESLSKLKIDRPEVSDAFISEFEKVKLALKNTGNSELAIVKTQYDERNKIIQDALSLQVINDKQAKDLMLKNSQKLFEDEKKAKDEAIKRQKEAIARATTEAQANPIKLLVENTFPNLASKSKEILSAAEQVAEEARARITGTLQGFLTYLKGGAEGAKNLIADAGGAFVGAFFGDEAGKIANDFIKVLSGGPEETKKMVDSFMNSIPMIIENIIASLPTLITRLTIGYLNIFRTLSERFPEIILQFINGIIDGIPQIIESIITFIPNIIRNLINGIPRLIKGLIEAMPQVAKSFASALIGEAPSIGAAVAEAIVKEITGKFKKVGQGAGDFFESVGGFFGDIGSSLGFARGGELRGGVPFRDSIPVMAQQGELFVDRGTTNKLKSYLDNNDSQFQNNAIISKVLDALSMPQTYETEVHFDNEAFANIILKLNRKNMRLA